MDITILVLKAVLGLLVCQICYIKGSIDGVKKAIEIHNEIYKETNEQIRDRRA